MNFFHAVKKLRAWLVPAAIPALADADEEEEA